MERRKLSLGSEEKLTVMVGREEGEQVVRAARKVSTGSALPSQPAKAPLLRHGMAAWRAEGSGEQGQPAAHTFSSQAHAGE